MEDGNWDEANRVKVLLEDKQRAASRKSEQDKILSASRGWSFVFRRGQKKYDGEIMFFV